MKNPTFLLTAAGLIAASVLFWTFMFQDRPDETGKPADGEITVTMYHGEGCMCCIRWAEYLEEEGFTVIDKKVENLFDVKDEYNIPYEVNSCHTAIVDGYVVEGHVPAEDIRNLLAERPDAIGISVPGMPPNAPGMDRPVSRPYHVIIFDHDQNMHVYNTHE